MVVLKENLPYIDMVISDYKMPGRNGVETLADIGTLHPEITKIILTGYATMEAAIQAINNGVDGFLTKPFDAARLQVTVRNAVQQHSLGRQLRDLASAAIDISDGLLGDLGHLCGASGVGAVIALDRLPLSAPLRRLGEADDWLLPLHGGDDYELCFTAGTDARAAVEAAAKSYED